MIILSNYDQSIDTYMHRITSVIKRNRNNYIALMCKKWGPITLERLLVNDNITVSVYSE